MDEELDTGEKKQKVWQLQIFEDGGITRLQQLSGGMGIDSDHETINCDGRKFEVTDWNYRERGPGKRSWEKPIASISFKFKNGCDPSTGKTVCDIEIAIKKFNLKTNLI